MKKNNLMWLASLSLVLLASCTKTEDLYDPNWVLKKYKMNWEQQFGEVDAEHTWNTAAARIVDVAVGYPGEFVAKIYTANPRNTGAENYLLAQYRVEGNGTITSLAIDMPACLHYVYVALIDANGGRMVKSSGFKDDVAEVVFGGMETKATRTDDEIETYVEYDADLIKALSAAMPEEVDISQTNGALSNYEFVSNGSFTLSPVYGITASNIELGYYYYDPLTQTIDERTDVVLIADLSENILAQTFDPAKGDWVYNPETSTSSPIGAWEDYNYQYIGGAWVDWGHTKLRAKSYTINVPVGCRVGFYLKNLAANYPKFYSNVNLNEDGAYYSATVTESGYFFVGLEDWLAADRYSADCNDVVFAVSVTSDGELPDPVDSDIQAIDETPMTYILACEDLGAADDFDFNDVVFSVSYVSGTKEATITALAAGGTLPAYINYAGQSLGEIHELLGASTGVMVNTGTGATGVKNVQTIQVDENFSMANDMGGFSITVVKGGDKEETVEVAAPGKGEAPQMICIAAATWAWPTERIAIHTAYPEFGDWGANYATNLTWYQSPVAENIYEY